MNSITTRVWIAGASGRLGSALSHRFGGNTAYKRVTSDRDVAVEDVSVVGRFADINHPDVIINIVDATNIERNLYLTTQLTELGIPVVIAINMIDVVRKSGDRIDIPELSRQLGCPVLEISALKGTGVMEAAEAAVKAAKGI